MLPVRRRDYRRFATDPFELMRRELDRLFTYWPETVETGDLTGEYPLDMREEDNKIVVEQEVPGFKSDEIDASIEGDVLNISAERCTPECQHFSHSRTMLHPRATLRHAAQRSRRVKSGCQAGRRSVAPGNAEGGRTRATPNQHQVNGQQPVENDTNRGHKVLAGGTRQGKGLTWEEDTRSRIAGYRATGP
jgi:hypothetical protein